jgi:polyhydroxyalkanoate synthesis regulator protein
MTLNSLVRKLGLSLLIFPCIMACKVSSGFKPGTSGNITASNIMIPIAENLAAQGPTNLSISFTEQIRNYYQSNTKLKVNSNQASDLELYITIKDFFAQQVQNSAVGAGQASQMELIVTVTVKFIDNENKINNLDNKQFSQKLVYNADKTLEQAQTEVLPDILSLLTQDIFNATLARW